jgi:hypothetical protein
VDNDNKTRVFVLCRCFLVSFCYFFSGKFSEKMSLALVRVEFEIVCSVSDLCS